MSYLILCDSCTDFTEDMKQDPHFAHIPLTIHIGDYDIIDDDTFDQQDFLRRIDAYPECAKSSCPAPDEYLKHFEMADDIYMVTLSSHHLAYSARPAAPLISHRPIRCSVQAVPYRA